MIMSTAFLDTPVGPRRTPEVILADLAAFYNNNPTDTAVAKLIAEQQSAFLDPFDNLTGLSTSDALKKQASALIDMGAKTIAFTDLRGFKAINDELGHEAGDVALRALGFKFLSLQRRQNSERRKTFNHPSREDRRSDPNSSGFVKFFRVGGDEIIALTTRTDHAEFARQLIEIVEEPIALDDSTTMTLGCRVGIATIQSVDLFDEAKIAADKYMNDSRDHIINNRGVAVVVNDAHMSIVLPNENRTKIKSRV
jgi:GGDEF domain-containing protein